MKRVIRYVLLLSAVALIAASGATAGSLITGAKVKDGSLTGRDVKNRSLTAKDFRNMPAAAAGAQGPAGPAGRDGHDGATGPQGVAGTAAAKGDPGAKGDTGTPGAQGAKGDTGATGAAGVPGMQGATGLIGVTGPAGAPGPAGTSLKHAYTLADTVRTPVASANPALNTDNTWSLLEELPSGDYHSIGSVGGYSFKMACIAVPKAPRPDDQPYSPYNWITFMDVKLAGASLQTDDAGQAASTSSNSEQYQPYVPPAEGEEYVAPDPIYIEQVSNAEFSGQMVDTFSTTTGEQVRVTAHLVVKQNSCEYRDTKIYVW
jgi:hypothetical protein